MQKLQEEMERKRDVLRAERQQLESSIHLTELWLTHLCQWQAHICNPEVGSKC